MFSGFKGKSKQTWLCEELLKYNAGQIYNTKQMYFQLSWFYVKVSIKMLNCPGVIMKLSHGSR